ncbi:Panacea domain-containing protein [Acinetobacter pseudolwoffii]|uniref:Panacea domain-containing protein n=1 Tax=Acinetobacter pseudolwoffii TaxID=2053287 RepID=UPI0021E46B00|nr:Panacea domain-containing protein [Acinetobacter pseudolwoffii]
MNHSLNDLIKYFCSMYPHSQELSKARLTKMIYLADWENFKLSNKQISDIKWYFDNFGPYVTDVVDTAYNDPDVRLVSTRTIYGTEKTLIEYKGVTPTLDEPVRTILDKVIESTKTLSWKNFIEYVYATPPIKESTRYNYLDFSKFI